MVDWAKKLAGVKLMYILKMSKCFVRFDFALKKWTYKEAAKPNGKAASKVLSVKSFYYIKLL